MTNEMNKNTWRHYKGCFSVFRNRLGNYIGAILDERSKSFDSEQKAIKWCEETLN